MCINFTVNTVMITRECDGLVSTSVYRKANYSGLVMQYDSFVPAYYKKV